MKKPLVQCDAERFFAYFAFCEAVEKQLIFSRK